MYFVTLFLLFCVVKTINHRMKCHKLFYALLSTTSPPQTNSKTTPSISRSNYSPPSSGRGWGRGFVCLPSFNLHLSTTSPPQTNSKTTPSISRSNYSPLSSERGWGWGFVSLSPFHEVAGGEAKRSWNFGFIWIQWTYKKLRLTVSFARVSVMNWDSFWRFVTRDSANRQSLGWAYAVLCSSHISDIRA